MAHSGTLSGSFNGTDGRIFTLYCYWTITAQDTATRRSTVRLRWAVQKSNAAWKTYKANAAWSQSVDGADTSGKVNFDIRNIGADTNYFFRDDDYVVIQHEANGTKSATISGTLDLSGTSAGIGSLSDTIVLDAIHVEPPTVDSFAVSDVGTGVSAVGVYVGTKSIIRLTASATAVEEGATIANYAFYANDTLLQTGTSSVYTGANPATAGSYVFKVVVTDSYGLTAERSLASLTVHAYTPPTIQTETFRCDSSGTEQRLGTYVRCKATWTITAVGSNAVVLHKVTVNGTDTVLTNGTAVTLGGGNIATNQVYDIVYVVTDKFGTPPATKTDQVLTGKYDWDFDPDGGVGFGTYAEAGKLKTTYDIETSGDVTIGGNLNLADFGAFILSGTTEYDYRTTTNTVSADTTKTYTVSGDGIVFVSSTIFTDNTSNYGTTRTQISKNGTIMAYSANRYPSAHTAEFGANAAVALKVANGDTISSSSISTKSGTKTIMMYVLALGCTLA